MLSWPLMQLVGKMKYEKLREKLDLAVKKFGDRDVLFSYWNIVAQEYIYIYILSEGVMVCEL